MDVTESYRILELDIGAARTAVDAAYCRLIDRWHPDRAAAGGPEAVREAQRMVQAINDAYQTLSKIAPDSAKPSPFLPAGAAPTAGAKPRLSALPPGPPASVRPPPPPPRSPPPEILAAPAAPVASAPPPANPLPPPPAPPTPPSAARAPPPALAPDLLAAPPETPDAPLAPSSDFLRKLAAYYEMLFPPDSPRRRSGPVIVAAALLFVLLLGKCAVTAVFTKSPEQQKAAVAAHVAQTTGRLVVKSNRANTTIEATRLPAAGETAPNAVNGPEEGAAEQTLAALPPGQYSLAARSAGWPEIRQDVNVEATRTTEVAINFKSGSLRLDSDPGGATVRLGTETLGKTPLLIPQLPPGQCQLTLEYPTWPAVTFKTAITENTEAAATVRLPHGKLTVETSPSGAMVVLGGRAAGQTPLTLERFPAGTRKLTLQAKDFPALEVSVAVEDRGEVKIHPLLGSGFPALDPEALLRAVWVPDDPNAIAPPLEGITGPSQPQNGIVKNLNRKRLYETWLRKRYCFTAIVKSYDQGSGQVEFTEGKSELSRYRVLAKLSSAARTDKELAAQLTKGATFALYGRLSAVEEPRWPFKVITFELTAVEPLR